jgi:hypothetical protein
MMILLLVVRFAFRTQQQLLRYSSWDSLSVICVTPLVRRLAGIDLFLTGDNQLMGLDVPGVRFIADFNTPLL